jgi:hypothetical protein
MYPRIGKKCNLAGAKQKKQQNDICLTKLTNYLSQEIEVEIIWVKGFCSLLVPIASPLQLCNHFSKVSFSSE